MEAKEDEEREAPLEAVIWAAAEIAAAANLRDYRNIPSRLRRRIRSLHCPHPIPELALEGIAGIRGASAGISLWNVHIALSRGWSMPLKTAC